MCYEYGVCPHCAEQHAQFKVGDSVNYRGGFGRGPIETVTIIGIDEKNGKVVYDLDNGHWTYESQVIGCF